MDFGSKTSLKEAVKFHGHLGPYLVLGILAGELALKRLKARKYFGLKVTVRGATEKPRSCLIDGLQLSSGATYGKGNILKERSEKISILFNRQDKNESLELMLKEGIIKKIDSLKSHLDSEAYAKELFKSDPRRLFQVRIRS